VGRAAEDDGIGRMKRVPVHLDVFDRDQQNLRTVDGRRTPRHRLRLNLRMTVATVIDDDNAWHDPLLVLQTRDAAAAIQRRGRPRVTSTIVAGPPPSRWTTNRRAWKARSVSRCPTLSTVVPGSRSPRSA